ncbi:MAG: hypothetical protein K6F53_06400 [Lachnospiraceae bacterium]|nr:hypothetical protein [Lachnospiraceae bacterium]
MGYISGWSDGLDPSLGGETLKQFNKAWYVIHSTDDAEGRHIGLYEEYEYGIKTMERFYSTPGKGYQGLLYEKMWGFGEHNEIDQVDAASREEDYDPSGVNVLLRWEAEFGGGFSFTPDGGAPAGIPSADGTSPEGDEETDSLADALNGEPANPYMHQKVYYQSNAEGETIAAEEQSLWKEIVFKWNPATYARLKEEHLSDWDFDEDAFDHQYGQEAWEAVNQKIYNRNGLMIREFYYVGTKTTYYGGTAEYVRDRVWNVAKDDSGDDARYLFIDQYIRWDQVDRGLFLSELNYQGDARKIYFAPGLYGWGNEWERLPAGAKKYVVGHLHGEQGFFNDQEYILGTWHSDPAYADVPPDVGDFHPWNPEDYAIILNTYKDETFLAEVDNRIGWKHIINNRITNDIIMEYEDLAPGIKWLSQLNE